MPLAVNDSTGEVQYLDSGGAWRPAQTAVNPQTKEMHAYDGTAWVPVPAKSKGVLGYIDDAVRSIAGGITFGYADEIAAKMDELTGRGGTYEQNIARERARDAQIPSAIAIPGEVAGAVGSTIAAAPIAAAAVPVRAAQALSQLPRAVQFGGLGAAQGALSGAGNAVEGERGQGALVGGGVGAGIGAVVPYAVGGLSRAYNAVRGALTPETNVAGDLSRAIARDADTPAALQARAANIIEDRPGVTIADVGGENVRGLVERVAQTPGGGRTRVVPTLTDTQRGQAARIASDLRELTGTGRSAFQAIEETTAQRAEAAAPLYRQAYEEGDRAIWSADLERLTGAPSVQRAMRGAVNAWRDRAIAEGYGAMNPGALVENGMVRFTGGNVPVFPNLQFWDYTKRMLDDQVRSALSSGQNQKAQALTQITNQLRDALDTAAPQSYRAARDAWSGPSRYLDAIEEGRNILQTRISSDELRAALPNMTTAEREGFRIGAISAIIGKMGNDTAKLADMTKYLRAPEVRAKLAAIMPDEEAAQAWARRLDFEVGSSEMTGRALGNSATARRLAEKQDAESLAGDLVMTALTGTPKSFVNTIIMSGPKWIKDTLRSRADAMLADVLTRPEGLRRLPGMLERATPPQPPSAAANAAAVIGTDVEANRMRR